MLKNSKSLFVTQAGQTCPAHEQGQELPLDGQHDQSVTVKQEARPPVSSLVFAPWSPLPPTFCPFLSQASLLPSLCLFFRVLSNNNRWNVWFPLTPSPCFIVFFSLTLEWLWLYRGVEMWGNRVGARVVTVVFCLWGAGGGRWAGPPEATCPPCPHPILCSPQEGTFLLCKRYTLRKLALTAADVRKNRLAMWPPAVVP